MRFALNSLAVLAPEWLLAFSDGTWLDRYGHRFEEAHLPKGQAERPIITERIGQDGAHLLTDLLAPTAPPWLRQVPAAKRLQQIWVQNYLYENDQLHWRTNENIPPAHPANSVSTPVGSDIEIDICKGGCADRGVYSSKDSSKERERV